MKETTNVDTSTSTPAVFEKLRDEALDLEMTDKFLASVEQKNRLVSGTNFDAGRLYEALTFLAAQESSGEQIDIENAELIAESELASWREILELRNSRIETYHIRRFNDHSEASLDMGLLVSLARVFHSLPFSESNQSKFDLVITRLFTKGNVETMRGLRLPREKVAEALAGILPQFTECDSEPDVESIVEDFDAFIATLKPISVLEDFIEKDSFEALRQYKRGLGKLFFHPRVTAAAIECNVTIGNVFAGLVNEVNGPLYELINNKFDFAGAFHDVSPSARTNLRDEINYPEADDEAELCSSDREQVREILEMIGGGDKTEIAEDKEIRELVALVSDSDEPEESAGERVNEILIKLGAENPDYSAIRDEAEKYEALKSIDLEYLLGGRSEALNEICRDVLAVIVWTEELCANELQGNDILSKKTKSEAATLIQLSEKYQQGLQNMMENAERQEQHKLLLVSNKLLASHLDLKRLLVRYTRSNLGMLQPKKAAVEPKRTNTGQKDFVPTKKEPKPAYTPKSTGGTNRWLIVVTVLLAIIYGLIHVVD